MFERRKTIRQRSFLGGRIEFNRTQTHDCLIRNVSHTGALLKCSASVLVPATMTLLVTAHGERRQARMIWRDQDAMGVAFVDASRPGHRADGRPVLTVIK